MQSIDVGGRILTALINASAPMTLRELSSLSGIAPGQAHAYLISFRRMGIVEQEHHTSRYLLGPFALYLGLARMRVFSPLKLASRAAIELCEETGLRVFVGVWGSHGATAVQIEDGAEDLHIDLRPGKVHSLLKTATGKIFAAFLPRSVVEPKIRAEIADWGRHQFVGEAPSIEQCIMQSAEVRSKGYATTEGDPTPGISTLSAPVLDQNGQIQFALTIVAGSRALDVRSSSPQVRRILEFTSGLSSQLGYEQRLADARLELPDNSHEPDGAEPKLDNTAVPAQRTGRRSSQNRGARSGALTRA